MPPKPIKLSEESKFLLSQMQDELNKCKKDITDKLSEEIADLKAEFSEFVSSKNAEIAEMKSEVNLLKTKVVKLENLLDDTEAYERRDTVVISGSSLPAFSPGENAGEIVKNLVKDQLRLDISSTDLSVAHRIGVKPPNQTIDKRPIIAKFCRRDSKREVILASKRVRNGGLFVNESLTPSRKKVFNLL